MRRSISRYLTPQENFAAFSEKSFFNLPALEKISSQLLLQTPNIIGFFVFFGASYFAYNALYWAKSAQLQLLFLSLLLVISLARTVWIVLHILLSPVSSKFRLLPISDKEARLLFTSLNSTFIYIFTSLTFTVVSYRLGASRETIHLLGIFSATILLLAAAAATILFRKNVQRHIVRHEKGDISWIRKQFAAIWHIPALLYLALLWILLVNTIDDSAQSASRGAFLVSFFILPIWLIADIFTKWVVKSLLVTLRIQADTHSSGNAHEMPENEPGKTPHQKCLFIARLILFSSLMIWLANLWGYRIALAEQFTSILFDAIIVIGLALIFWQFVSSWIEHKVAESTPENQPEDKDDGEWGAGAVKSRAHTLFPLLRKFIGTVLIIMVAMIILSSMGVNIGPLLAGAGVIGLAIGFGAQKLVSDIFSGFFYLFDDAFRVGEYLEAGTVSGIVENITLRNIMLRHHRGMLQIVPHSELGAITNFMRGGIVVKFNLDFPYDADIDQIRKVVKKVGQEMLKDEELGKDFIKPVKSQGVREIANSVMTIRVKFTAQPGAHFIIRREAFKRITEALRQKGIQYAHRKVIVDLPEDNFGFNSTIESVQKEAALKGAAAAEVTDQQRNTEKRRTDWDE